LQRVILSLYRRIVILTGAGVSAASGIRTFRGAGGLWEEMDPAQAGSLSALKTQPKAVWQLFGPLRRQLSSALPNAAHEALAAAEARLTPRQHWSLLTQNVDGLHQRAGSRAVVELHGTVHRTRCSREDCSLPPFEDAATHEDNVPLCPRCGSPLRPDVVLFEEPIPAAQEMQAKAALRECDLFIAVGTSGAVTPAANFVRSADYAGARTILVNLEPMEPRNRYFQEEYLGRAEELLPQLING
jgi:NAD-dependent deacetylase